MVNKNFNSYNKAVTNPCYQCKERKVGCHSTCEKYQNFVEENQKRKDLKLTPAFRMVDTMKTGKYLPCQEY